MRARVALASRRELEASTTMAKRWWRAASSSSGSTAAAGGELSRFALCAARARARIVPIGIGWNPVALSGLFRGALRGSFLRLHRRR